MKYLKLLRYRQWIKNLILFFPIFFGGVFFELKPLGNTLIAFISFCLISSTGYIINDIKDRKKDALHIKKKNRPIASGQIHIFTASLIAVILFFISIFVGITIGKYFVILMLIYFVNVMVYTFLLKKIAYVDILMIALGFMIRLYSGSIASGVHLSLWLIVVTGTVAMMLGSGKRYEELGCKLNVSTNVRESLEKYRTITIKYFLVIMAILSVLLFGVYLKPKNYFDYGLLLLSGILVFNYVYNVIKNCIGEPTDFFMKNKFNFVLLSIWTILFLKKIYL